MLDATGFPVTSKGKTSILFDDRLGNHILQVLRNVGFFVVLFVVYDESVYFPPKFPSHVNHAVFLILALLQRNQDVDSLVLERLLQTTRVPNFLIASSLALPLVLQCRIGLPVPVRHTE